MPDIIYTTTNTELTSVANAIRQKTGKQGTIEYPAGYVTEIGSISGGGGDGDFSTAELTLISEEEQVGGLNIITVNEENEIGEGAPACINYFIYPIHAGENKYKIPLYKGVCVQDINLEDTTTYASYSGNITPLSGGAAITGDCTIVLATSE